MTDAARDALQPKHRAERPPVVYREGRHQFSNPWASSHAFPSTEQRAMAYEVSVNESEPAVAIFRESFKCSRYGTYRSRFPIIASDITLRVQNMGVTALHFSVGKKPFASPRISKPLWESGAISSAGGINGAPFFASPPLRSSQRISPVCFMRHRDGMAARGIVGNAAQILLRLISLLGRSDIHVRCSPV